MYRLVTCTALLLAAGCKTAVVPQLTSSGSMGIATVTVGGKQQQKIFLPQTTLDANTNNPTIAVLDATYNLSGSPLLDTIDLPGHVDHSFPSAIAANATVVVAIGVTSPYVDFIDPVADKVLETVQLPAAILTPDGGDATFTGTSTIVQGVVIDSANNRAILATAGGFLPVDLTSHAFGTLVATPAPSENFGFWPSKEWILAPFYLCTPCGAPSGLQLVDLTAGKVYLLGSPDGGSLVGVQPASADVDPLTDVVVVPDQSAGTVYTLNLLNAQLNAGAGTFTAPLGKAPSVLVSGSYSGVALDQVNHQAFLEEAGGIGVAIVGLPQQLTDGGVNPTQASTATVPNPPDGSNWTNSSDPHGVAVALGLASGNPVGFLANQGNTQVVRIDLDGFAGAGTSGGAVSATDFVGLVTFIPNHN